MNVSSKLLKVVDVDGVKYNAIAFSNDEDSLRSVRLLSVNMFATTENGEVEVLSEENDYLVTTRKEIDVVYKVNVSDEELLKMTDEAVAFIMSDAASYL